MVRRWEWGFYLGHWLSERTAEDVFEVWVHAGGDDDDEDETEQPAGAYGHEDAVGDCFCGVRGFFAQMDAGIEAPYRPDWTEPGQHKSPAGGPGGQIRGGRKDVGTIIAVRCLADWKRNDGCEDQDEIHHHEDGLKLPHYPAHGRCEDPVEDDACEEYCVDDPIGGCVRAIRGDDNHGQEHQGEAICKGSES